MKIKNANFRNIVNILILVASVTAINQVIGLFYKDTTEKNNFIDARTSLLREMYRSANINDSTQFRKICNNCVKIMKHSSTYEVDSLREFLTLFIKNGDDVSRDIANSIRDSGPIDTINLLQPITVTEAKEVCSKSGILYPVWRTLVNRNGTQYQQQRNSMDGNKTDAEKTAIIRNIVLQKRVKIDSSYHLFYNTVFNIFDKQREEEREDNQ
jgi:hypothetical protein